MRTAWLRFLATGVIATAGIGAATVPGARAAVARNASSPRVCRGVSIPTGLSAASRQDLTVYGEFCVPARSTPQTIQVLVPGGTYSHTYWDFPGFSGKYSYARYMNGAGYATLAIDPLGVGGSSHPPGLSVTIQSEAYAVHSALQAARDGGIGEKFARVILVGHSLGTLTNDIEAATYHDEDGFIATGTSHGPGAAGLVEIFTHAEPALLDPVTAPQIPLLDLTYISLPGARSVFYAGGAVGPAVEAADEATRSPGPAGYLATLAPDLADTQLLGTNSIHVPVLLADGSNDAVFCRQGGALATANCASAASLYASESPFYSPAAHLQAYVLPGSGHAINLVPDAPLWYAKALAWCKEYFPA
jgi:pimeloyl-ACP methyl ester carboxylesterase